MEPIVNYLEDAEKKMMNEMSMLFSKMRGQRDVMSLEGIQDMYDYKAIEGVLYEPCIQIPMGMGPRKGYYYWNDFTLPKDEYVIFINETTQQAPWQSNNGPSYNCIALTNFGRCFITNQVIEVRNFPTNDFLEYSGTYVRDSNKSILKLEPFPYKMPKQYFSIFLLGFKQGNSSTSSLHSGYGVVKTLSNSLQELNRAFYLFAGKWQPHMSEHATLDTDSMRQTIIENTRSIEELQEKRGDLEQQNARLQKELNLLKETKATLEREKATLLPLEKYKTAVLEFMNDHKGIVRLGTNDKEIIESFKAFHSDKVFMDSWEYDDVLKSKDELNEYRIYKKVKGEMVSNGLDNSSVARNVRKIKKSVNELNNTGQCRS